MIKKTVVRFIFSCFFVSIAASCSRDVVPTPATDKTFVPISLCDIPFATQNQLDAWQGDPNIVYYRTARMLAMIELEYSSHKVSERPVILFDFDSTPRYYEFIVTGGDGAPQSTICTYARKEQPAVVAFILPFLREYNPIATKSFGTHTFVLNYPSQFYYGFATRSGDAPASLFHLDGRLEQEIPPVQHLLDPIEQMERLGDDFFNAMGIEDLTTQKAAIADAFYAEKEAAVTYWEQVALIEEELIAQEKKGWMQTKATTTRIDEFVLPQYDTEQMQKTRWMGGCGPSALANMYRGLYDSYKGFYLPLWGDPDFLDPNAPGRIIADGRAVYFYKDFEDDDNNGKVNIVDPEWIKARSAFMDNGLYADICDYWWYSFPSRIPFFPNWGAALPINLTHSLERISNNEYTLSVLPILFSHHHIRSEKLSVILLSTDFNHFLHAYGSRLQYWKWETVFTLFGKELHIGLPEMVTHRWFKINDSGTDMVDYDMLPFWMDDCISNSILHFGVYKKCN